MDQDYLEIIAEAMAKSDDEITALRAENVRLRVALAFYADEANYKQFYVASRGFSVSETLCDNGMKAREALRTIEQKAPEREYDPNVAPCDDAEFGMKP